MCGPVRRAPMRVRLQPASLDGQIAFGEAEK